MLWSYSIAFEYRLRNVFQNPIRYVELFRLNLLYIPKIGAHPILLKWINDIRIKHQRKQVKQIRKELVGY